MHKYKTGNTKYKHPYLQQCFFYFILTVYLSVGLTTSLLEKEQGQMEIIFPKGWDEIQNTCKKILHFFYLKKKTFTHLILPPLECRFLIETRPISAHCPALHVLLEHYLLPGKIQL